MTYFRMGIHTIIGAESFHFPVRDGKEWDQLAMVVRQTVVGCQVQHGTCPTHSEEVSLMGSDCNATGLGSGSSFAFYLAPCCFT